MQLGEALYSRLSGYSALSALVSTRIYPDLAPAGAALPYVAYAQITEIPTRAGGGDASLTASVIQVTVWGSTPGSRDTVAAQVLGALRSYSGTITSGDDTFVIQRIFFDNRNDSHEVDPETKLSTYGAQLDFTVWWER